MTQSPSDFMDKKHLLIGIASIVLAMVLLFRENHRLADNWLRAPSEIVEQVPPPIYPFPEEAPGTAPSFSLENDFVSIEISGHGGNISTVSLKKHAAAVNSAEPWIFNPGPGGTLTVTLGNDISLSQLSFTPISISDHAIVLTGQLPDGTAVEREYSLDEREPYLLHHFIRLVHPSHISIGKGTIKVGLGNFSPSGSDDTFLNFGSYDGHKARFVPLRAFPASRGFLGIGRRGERRHIEDTRPALWAAIKNQFFVTILTPNVPAHHTVASVYGMPDGGKALGGMLQLSLTSIADGISGTSMDYYVGPKEYARLERMGQNQDLVMQFSRVGLISFISKLLLLLMMGIHGLVHNWGWSIILLTVLVRLLLWPLTGAQVRSSRAMAKLQKPLKEIRERYGQKSKKTQMETLQLFREAGVNPAAGCLPIFIQLPIFFGLFYMLRSAAELRFANFFWIRDLSAADTIARLGHFPINPLPMVMGITQFIQMRTVPTTAQSPSQKWLFRLMPLLILFFCYSFPSGLILYWTVQNVLSIFQQAIIQRRLREEEKNLAKNPPVRRKSGHRKKG
jgi:YidC/Oxa1 family membrane protein insertase